MNKTGLPEAHPLMAVKVNLLDRQDDHPASQSGWHPLLNRETTEQIRRWREEDRRRGIIWNDEESK